MWSRMVLDHRSAQVHLAIVFYFLCRYCIFFALIGLLLSLSVTRPINCSALYTFNSWTGNMAILAASTSLMIRTIALWERKPKVVIPLLVLCVAHWAILWRGMFIVRATYDDTEDACTVTATDHIFLNISFFTTMGFDLIILGFTIASLTWRHRTRSDLWHLLFRDGLVYFVITFLCNAIPAVFNVLNLNPIMNVIATIPAATFSCIAACRLVVRLQDFNRNSGDIFVNSASHYSTPHSPRSQIRFSKMHANRLARAPPRRPEVCITTDHFVLNDMSPITPTTATPLSPYTPVTPGSMDRGASFDFKIEQVQKDVESGVYVGDSEIFGRGKEEK
ncbi:hypothetical protein BXZ70DRAFT_426153 [Cristinia sonorae]|uniref:Uncharacterized protein n=1 Tax=Cristinia sonorae TaxID=1940300 RepID=A0A8K0UXI2_9AGAR|nr:hypothetical protein BXZ70DRAFT_426153 [Cristinia sonorae]